MKNAVNLNAQATMLRSITPSDTIDIPDGPTRSLTCTGSGIAYVVADGDTNAVPIYLNAGFVFPVFAKRVMFTNTTATGIVGMY